MNVEFWGVTDLTDSTWRCQTETNTLTKKTIPAETYYDYKGSTRLSSDYCDVVHQELHDVRDDAIHLVFV